jgi:3-phenylpropionate/cinnamic acid dioxygenase small subunit
LGGRSGIGGGSSLDLADAALRAEIEELLYLEAELLDDRRLDDWLDLWTEDCHYWMPIRSTRARGDEQHELTKEWENSYFDDDKLIMRQRVAKVATRFAWSEEPPSRTRHLLTNIRIRPGGSPDELDVVCNFAVYRTRLSLEEDKWIGERHDTLRRVNGSWRFASRKIFLDEAVLKSKNLSVFL